MNKLLLFCLLLSATSQIFAQNSGDADVTRKFGVAINSSLSGVIGEISVAPTGLIYLNKSQLEVGFCLYPFNFSHPRMLGGSLDYKYFPNGIGNRFNLYFNANLNFTNEFIDHNYIINNYQSTYNYLSLTAGYGFQLKILKNAFIGTNLNFGMNTNSRHSTDPQGQYERPLFESFEMDGAIRIDIGYRF